jgi:hypothetical protein
MICQCCQTKAPTKYIEFHQNIGVLYVRFYKNIKGNLCKQCINRYFWEFTTINLICGWWGVISFCITPVIIVTNLIYYLLALSLYLPSTRKTPRVSNGEIPLSGNSATPKASEDFDRIKSSLDGLAQFGWLMEESSWSANFTLDPSELSDTDRLDRVVKALLDRARRVAPGFSVPMMVPRIEIESMPAAAGQFEVDEEGWVTIRISPDFERDLPAARAILAHEVCHYILDNRGIRQPNFELNERDTDLCMFICGFGEVFLAGYKRVFARNEYRHGHRLGYLTDAEYEFANRYTNELRAIYRQNLQSELDVLKERLFRKAQGDRDRVRRLIEYERRRNSLLSELELYRDAIARFDRDYH